jgi:hypothetical protein
VETATVYAALATQFMAGKLAKEFQYLAAKFRMLSQYG